MALVRATELCLVRGGRLGLCGPGLDLSVRFDKILKRLFLSAPFLGEFSAGIIGFFFFLVTNSQSP